MDLRKSILTLTSRGTIDSRILFLFFLLGGSANASIERYSFRPSDISLSLRRLFIGACLCVLSLLSVRSFASDCAFMVVSLSLSILRPSVRDGHAVRLGKLSNNEGMGATPGF